MMIERKQCNSCIWWKLHAPSGRAMCALKNTTLHQLFYNHVQIECYDYEYYCHVL